MSITSKLRDSLTITLRKAMNHPVRTLDLINAPEYYRKLHSLLHIAKVEGFDLVRTGKHQDGGYIMLNDFQAENIAYSFRISDDVSWDKDMASRGYDVFMYDHTIDKLPEENPRFHWSKLGIADGHTHDDRLKTLDELMRANHHEGRHNMLLKMDVEGAEWGFFEQVSSETLSQFSQMTFEFHEILSHPKPELVLSVFQKINQTHQLIHMHANNNGAYISFGDKFFCDSPELSYVLRSKYSIDDNYDVNLPLSIDEANFPSLPEVELGRWNEAPDIGERLTVYLKAF